uniref:ATP-dependent DNA helicase n=1 Tax=Mycena chlorophos TaxID=658473 RepID=A0ABQ0LAR9_MYCCL|nr:ATP-dependent DNA helicase [Mycena chlorophos]
MSFYNFTLDVSSQNAAVPAHLPPSSSPSGGSHTISFASPVSTSPSSGSSGSAGPSSLVATVVVNPELPNTHTHTHTNANTNTNTNFDSNALPSGQPGAASPQQRYRAAEFSDVPPETKTAVVRALCVRPGFGSQDYERLATLHYGVSATISGKKKKTSGQLKADFLAHTCSVHCLVRTEHVALIQGAVPPLSELMFSLCARALKLRLSMPSNPRKRKSSDVASGPNKFPRRTGAESSPNTRPARASAAPLEYAGDVDPFRVLSWNEKRDIVREFRSATSNTALKRSECSFCGALESVDSVHLISTEVLDISLLVSAVDRLRVLLHQPCIEVFRPETLVDGCYVLCTACRREVAHSKFKHIPLRSYANGLWTGLCPPELSDLTFLEEQCIARARATRCMFKLELGPTGQYASRGNVCVFPQDPTSLVEQLPPPLSALRDEVCIILVGSPDTVVTADMLSRTPLLVRRSKIIDALLWLRANNPLYGSLDINTIYANAASYPEAGVPFPVTDYLRTAASGSEGSSYVQDANDQLSPNVNLHSIPSTTVVDADQVDSTFQSRKLHALQMIKASRTPFVKFPSGSEVLRTRDNPVMYGRLFPTLFPYGVGMMENTTVSLDQAAPFRKIPLKTHVTHLLTRGPDHRFQTHLSFGFVVGNIMQRRQSSFDAKLAIKRRWFPKVYSLYQQIGNGDIASFAKKIKQNPFAKPETPGEVAAASLVQYVSYVAENIPGSTAEMQLMRKELFSIVNCEGLPHVFFTLNPADSCNPIAQVLAGRNIDLDKFFHDLSPGAERDIRAKTLAQNPVAGAEFFHLSVTALLNILFGTDRPSRIGVFGEIGAYYGVVEAQGRGSLHLHILLWRKHAPSPLKLQERMKEDPQFAQRVYDWHDDVYSFSMPDATAEFVHEKGTYTRLPVMSRPADPDDPDFEANFAQELRDIIENVGQIHTHTDTCFKYLPKTLRNQRDNDKDCRFNLPRDKVEKTHIDEEGVLHLRCNDGRVNGHNPVVTSVERCNTDAKPIASGTVAMAMFGYFSHYTIKSTMDTAMIFSALCAAIKALQDKPPQTADGEPCDQTEQSRLLLVKSVNQLVGKRELSSQQMAAHLLGCSNKYTNRAYPKFFWTRMLNECTGNLFVFTSSTNDSDQPSENGPISAQNNNQELDALNEDASSASLAGQTTEQLVDESMALLTADLLGPTDGQEEPEELDSPTHSLMFSDIFDRPSQLTDLCAWDIWVGYEKHKLPTSRKQSKEFLRFGRNHPQATTHCLKKIDQSSLPRVPVLLGVSFPRRDRPDDEEKYCAAALALFKPWSMEADCPLKAENQSWKSAFESFQVSLSAAHQSVLDNMQLIYETRDAKQDYSAMRRKRIAELARSAAVEGFSERSDEPTTYDPEWINAMQTQVEEVEDDPIARDAFLSPDCTLMMEASTQAGFYKRPPSSEIIPRACRALLADDDDALLADQAHKDLQSERQDLLKSRREEAARSSSIHQRRPNSGVPLPMLSTLLDECARARALLEQRAQASGKQWSSFRIWQQLAMALILKHNLNARQTLAFLILADSVGRQSETAVRLDPLRLLVTGPGGTGKSQIFKAWTEFHRGMEILNEFCLTGPTGVVASDIGGSTTHSMVSLCVDQKNMLATTPQGQKLRAALEERLALVRTMVVDEIYFLGASEMSVLSKYLSLAKGYTLEPFGLLNIVACGDPCQLPPPKSRTLFDRNLVHCYTESSSVNGGNASTQENIRGIEAFHQINRVVVLTEIMRQKTDPILVDLLSRLRTGTCTSADKTLLDRYVLSSPDCTDETCDLIDVRHWINGVGCPLITYKNEARDAHNFKMCQAFADTTAQESAIYYSVDTRGRGTNKQELKGIAAEAAWRVPVKEANDLGGKMPFVPGCPVFCTENIATELGISKGSMGTLVSLKYVERNSRRYAICAEVDFPGYKGKDPDHPHRVLLKRATTTIHFTLPNSTTQRSATRLQLPIIPAFAFTSHNSQGRSLDKAAVDLASCRNIQSAYVMLSRVRSLKGLCILRPFNLKIIQNHISQELREELERTDRLARKTLEWARVELDWYYSANSSDVFSVLDK